MVEKKEKADLKEKEEVSSVEKKAATSEEKREVPSKKEAPSKEKKEAPAQSPVEVKETPAQEKDVPAEAKEDTAPVKTRSKKFDDTLKCVMEMDADERLDFGVELLKGLTLIEVSRWVKSLEKEFGVSAQAVSAGVPAAGAGGAASSSEPEAKTSFDVILASAGEKKIHVIKEVRAITGLGLREAKALVDEAPKPVKENLSQEEADEVKAKLEAVGAVVEVK